MINCPSRAAGRAPAAGVGGSVLSTVSDPAASDCEWDYTFTHSLPGRRAGVLHRLAGLTEGAYLARLETAGLPIRGQATPAASKGRCGRRRLGYAGLLDERLQARAGPWTGRTAGSRPCGGPGGGDARLEGPECGVVTIRRTSSE